MHGAEVPLHEFFILVCLLGKGIIDVALRND